MRITFSPLEDAAYIYLVDEVGPGEVAKTWRCEGGSVFVDFDRAGQLLGIEVLHARRVLPAVLIAEASANGDTEEAS